MVMFQIVRETIRIHETAVTYKYSQLGHHRSTMVNFIFKKNQNYNSAKEIEADDNFRNRVVFNDECSSRYVHSRNVPVKHLLQTLSWQTKEVDRRFGNNACPTHGLWFTRVN